MTSHFADAYIEEHPSAPCEQLTEEMCQAWDEEEWWLLQESQALEALQGGCRAV